MRSQHTRGVGTGWCHRCTSTTAPPSCVFLTARPTGVPEYGEQPAAVDSGLRWSQPEQEFHLPTATSLCSACWRIVGCTVQAAERTLSRCRPHIQRAHGTSDFPLANLDIIRSQRGRARRRTTTGPRNQNAEPDEYAAAAPW